VKFMAWLPLVCGYLHSTRVKVHSQAWVVTLGLLSSEGSLSGMGTQPWVVVHSITLLVAF